MFGGFLVFFTRSRIETAAQAIADPVERLRFLRSATRRSHTASWVAAVLVVLLAVPQGSGIAARRSLKAAVPAHTHVATGDIPNVWLVERAADYEVYSNGLRIENELAVANEPRSYRLIDRNNPYSRGPERTVPAGIVFHTTESE